MSPNTEVKTVDEIKARRVAIDAEVQQVRKVGTTEVDMNTIDHELYSFAEGSVMKSLIEAKMWYGKMLEALGNPFPAELADKANVQ